MLRWNKISANDRGMYPTGIETEGKENGRETLDENIVSYRKTREQMINEEIDNGAVQFWRS